jgi:hypothetical protein
MLTNLGSLFSRFLTTFAYFRMEATITRKSLIILLAYALYTKFRTGVGLEGYLMAGMGRDDFVGKDKFCFVSSKQHSDALNILAGS